MMNKLIDVPPALQATLTVEWLLNNVLLSDSEPGATITTDSIVHCLN